MRIVLYGICLGLFLCIKAQENNQAVEYKKQLFLIQRNSEIQKKY